jgi:mannose-6-phosphate isomerase-like protein (cupin superfamily)
VTGEEDMAKLGGAMEKVSLSEKLSLIDDYWKPRIVGEFNGQEAKIVKFLGTFVWHRHDSEDELFLCLSGECTIEFQGSSVTLAQGDMVVVPRGVEHRSSAEREAHLLICEPIGTRNTGNIVDPVLTAPLGVKI